MTKVVVIVKGSGLKYQIEAHRLRDLLVQLDKVRDKLYMQKSKRGVSGAILGINEIKRFLKYSAKSGEPTEWIPYIEITEKDEKIYIEGDLNYNDCLAVVKAFSGNEVSISKAYFRDATFRIRVY